MPSIFALTIAALSISLLAARPAWADSSNGRWVEITLDKGDLKRLFQSGAYRVVWPGQ